MRLLLAICLGRGEEARVFGSLRKGKAKRALADEGAAVPMGRFIAQGGEDESVACTGMVFTLGSNRGTHGKKDGR